MKSIIKTILRSKILMVVLGLLVKNLLVALLALVLAGDLIKFVGIMSFTAPVNFTVILFMVLIDIVTLGILLLIADAYFQESSSFKKFLLWMVFTFFLFFANDVFLSFEPRSKMILSHGIASTVLFLRYNIYFIIVVSLILRSGKITRAQRETFFLNYKSFYGKGIVSEGIFRMSRFLYERLGMFFYLIVLLIVDFIALQFYDKSYLFFIQFFLLMSIELFIIIFVIHQLNVIFQLYNKFLPKN